MAAYPEDVCDGMLRAAACVDESDHHALMAAPETTPLWTLFLIKLRVSVCVCVCVRAAWAGASLSVCHSGWQCVTLLFITAGLGPIRKLENFQPVPVEGEERGS